MLVNDRPQLSFKLLTPNIILSILVSLLAFSLTLLAISQQGMPSAMLGHASHPSLPLIAVGVVPMGTIAIGIVPMGVIAIGVVPMGLISLGFVAMGALAVGLQTMGLLGMRRHH